MQVILIATMALVVCLAMVMIAVFSPGLGHKTCNECGGRLPVIRLAQQSLEIALGDWACPKCGTRFDPQGRARDQWST